MTETFIQIRDGKVVNPKAIREAFNLPEGKYLVRISKANKRSLQANAYYWLCLSEYVQPGLYDAGYREIKTKEDAHEFCRAQFLKKSIVNELTGEVKETIRSTTELNTQEFAEYIEQIAQMSAEFLGIVIPSPESQISIYGE